MADDLNRKPLAAAKGLWPNLKFGEAGGAFVGLILLCVGFSLSSEHFFSVRNALNILDQITVLGILAVGMTMVIIIGGIDLSVGSVLALSTMMLGWMMRDIGAPLPVCILVGILAGGLCGLISGASHHLGKTAAVRRDFGDAVVGARNGEYPHRRTANYRLFGMVHRSGHCAPFRFFVDHDDGFSRDCDYRLDLSAFSGRRAQSLRRRRQSGSREVGGHPGCGRSMFGFMRLPGFWPESPESPSRRAWIRRSRAPAWLTNWTPSPRSSSAARA